MIGILVSDPYIHLSIGILIGIVVSIISSINLIKYKADLIECMMANIMILVGSIMLWEFITVSILFVLATFIVWSPLLGLAFLIGFIVKKVISKT